MPMVMTLESMVGRNTLLLTAVKIKNAVSGGSSISFSIRFCVPSSTLSQSVKI